MYIADAAGDFDSTLSNSNKVTFRFNEQEDTFQGVVIQLDGKIVVAGNNWLVADCDSLQRKRNFLSAI